MNANMDGWVAKLMGGQMVEGDGWTDDGCLMPQLHGFLCFACLGGGWCSKH